MNIEIDTDAARLDVDAIHAFLTRSYWAAGVSRERVAKSLERSLCFGLYADGEQIGFARVVTDRVTFGYLCDVYVLEAQRGREFARPAPSAAVRGGAVQAREARAQRGAAERSRAGVDFMQIRGDSP